MREKIRLPATGKYKILVTGAGPTGLSTALLLAEKGHEVTVIEKEGQVGGLASSFIYDGFSLDFGPHKIYTQFDHVIKEYKRLLGEDLLAQPKKSKIRLLGKYFSYPVNIREILFGMNPLLAAKCGFSYFLATIRRKFGPVKEDTYEDYIVNRFGSATYDLVFRDFAKKVWGDPKKLSGELAAARLSIPSLGEMLVRLVMGEGSKKEIHAKTFYYPKHGAKQLYDVMAKRLEEKGGKLILGAKLDGVELDESGKRVGSVSVKHKSGKAENFSADWFVSTIPIHQLPTLFSPKPSHDVLKAAESLSYRSLILFYIHVRKPRLFDDSFIFYPEKEFPFHRLSEQKAFSPFTTPPGETVLCVEMARDQSDPLMKASDAELFEHVMPALEKTGFLKRDEVKHYFSLKMHGIYPVYDVTFRKNLNRILEFTDGVENLVTSGRRGLFNYNNQDHCMDMAFKTVDYIDSGRGIDYWRELRRSFDKYVIID